jgi:hypothetical protein
MKRGHRRRSCHLVDGQRVIVHLAQHVARAAETYERIRTEHTTARRMDSLRGRGANAD